MREIPNPNITQCISGVCHEWYVWNEPWNGTSISYEQYSTAEFLGRCGLNLGDVAFYAMMPQLYDNHSYLVDGAIFTFQQRTQGTRLKTNMPDHIIYGLATTPELLQSAAEKLRLPLDDIVKRS